MCSFVRSDAATQLSVLLVPPTVVLCHVSSRDNVQELKHWTFPYPLPFAAEWNMESLVELRTNSNLNAKDFHGQEMVNP